MTVSRFPRACEVEGTWTAGLPDDREAADGYGHHRGNSFYYEFTRSVN